MNQTSKTSVLTASFSSLQDHNYRYYWFGMLASVFAMQLEILTRGWLVFDLTKSPVWLGLVGVAAGAPMIFLSPFGGIAADRLDKRKLLMWTQAVPAAVNFVVGLLVILGLIQPWQIVVSALFSGLTWSFNFPTRQAYIVDLVPRRDRLNAVALTASGMNLSRVAGPAVAGMLIGAIGTANVYFFAVLLYVVSILLLVVVRKQDRVVQETTQSVISDLKDGLAYIRSDPVVMTLLTTAVVFMVLGLPYSFFLPAFAADVLNVGPEGLGWLSTAVSIGALIGSFAVAFLGTLRRKGVLQLFGSVSFSLALLVFCFSTSLSLSLVALLFVGLFAVGFQSLNMALVQVHAPSNMQGRVISVYGVGWGLPPLGVFPLSFLAVATSIPFAVGLAAVLLLCFMVVMFVLRPAQRNL